MLKDGYITFGSFNNFAKVTPEVMALWAQTLKAVPDSRLLLKANSLADPETKHYMMQLFEREGVSGERIELRGWEPSVWGHMETYNRIDIGLDTFPYNGTTTTCEALYMGVPVVTLAGDVYACRTGISLLTNIGLPELVGHTSEEYVRIAVQLAHDFERLRILKTELRDRILHSPIMDAARFVIHLEHQYRMIWKKWCMDYKSDSQGT
jgi:predicted O-linked N-acetylglucosamine transferase (SPINDLY family)